MKTVILILSLFGAQAHASDAGTILNGYAAKDFCSCLFVVGLGENECKKRIGVGFPLPHGKIRVDRKNGVVEVGHNHPENVRVAVYTHSRLGCRLLAPDSE